jgi:hypothetical protein
MWSGGVINTKMSKESQKIEAVSSSETLVPVYQTKQPHSLIKPKDNNSTTDNRRAISKVPSVTQIRSEVTTVIIYSI